MLRWPHHRERAQDRRDGVREGELPDSQEPSERSPRLDPGPEARMVQQD